MNAADHPADSGMAVVTVTVPDEAATRALAARLARQCKPGDCILLSGELGSGKTAFARGFIQSLQVEPEEVVSPTFTLVQTYPVQGGAMVWHFDFYRLRHRDEAVEIGLEEALNAGITLIEWPQLARELLPAQALDVAIRPGDTEGARVFAFAGAPAAWQDRLHHIMKDKVA